MREQEKREQELKKPRVTIENGVIVIYPLSRYGKVEEKRVKYFPGEFERVETQISTKEVPYDPKDFSVGCELEFHTGEKNTKEFLQKLKDVGIEAKGEAQADMIEIPTKPFKSINSIEKLVNSIRETISNLLKISRKEGIQISPFSFPPLKEPTPFPSFKMYEEGAVRSLGPGFFEKYGPSAIQISFRIGREEKMPITLENYLRNFYVSLLITPFLNCLSQSSPFSRGKANGILEEIPEQSIRILNLAGDYAGAGYGSLQLLKYIQGAVDQKPSLEGVERSFLEYISKASEVPAILYVTETPATIGTLRGLALNDIIRPHMGEPRDFEVSACDSAGFRMERLKAILLMNKFFIDIFEKENFVDLIKGLPFNFESNYQQVGRAGKRGLLKVPAFLLPSKLNRIANGEKLEESLYKRTVTITSEHWFQAFLKFAKEDSPLKRKLIENLGEENYSLLMEEIESFLEKPSEENPIESYYFEGKGTFSEACWLELRKQIFKNPKFKIIRKQLETIESLQKKLKELPAGKERKGLEDEVVRLKQNFIQNPKIQKMMEGAVENVVKIANSTFERYYERA